MKAPRFRLSRAIAFVALAAFNFGAIRAWSDLKAAERMRASPDFEALERYRLGGDWAGYDSLHKRIVTNQIRASNNEIRSDLLVTGALPMGNILVVGLLIVHRRRRSRPFLSGFGAFGAMAMAIYIVGVSCSTEMGLRPYLELVFYPLRKSFGQSTHFYLIACSVFVLMFVLPQVAFALIGGFLFRRCRTDERRDQTRC
jgi:hypothetical protein